MKIVLVLVLLVLAGCGTAMSPPEVVNRGDTHVADTLGTPMDAASCLARNAEWLHDAWAASVRTFRDRGAETIVRVTQGFSPAVVVGHFEPAPRGSKALLYFNPIALHFRDKAGLAAQLLKGC